MDISESELVCDVTTNEAEIADFLKTESNKTKVIFCTYQSLEAVINAQQQDETAIFDLIICDEAHRTTGVLTDKISGFKAVHHHPKSHKRLYMTATEKIYTPKSKKTLATKGINFTDMSDQDIYGPRFYKLKFKDAVEDGMLSDYRVIVMGIHSHSVWSGVRKQLLEIAERDDFLGDKKPLIVTNEDLQKILAVSLAINGVTYGVKAERPEQLYRSIIFANTIIRSKFYTEALQNSLLKRFVTKEKSENQDSNKALKTEAKHLDASFNSYERLKALNDLNSAENDNTARMLCNVGLFGEGVDVPSLDAVIFLEPRKNQIDIVQAIGRVMRKAENKKLGYVIIPIPIGDNQTLEETLAEGSHGYEVVGQVLSALKSHDERLAETPLKFIQVEEIGATPTQVGQVNPDEEAEIELDPKAMQQAFALTIDEVGSNIYAQVVSSSGLGSLGKMVTDEIGYKVDRVASILMDGRQEALEDADFIHKLASSLGINIDNNESDICKIGALLIANACLLQKRLKTVGVWQKELIDMQQISQAGLEAIDLLKKQWQLILNKDYRPVFEPALATLEALPNRPYVAQCVRMLVECADNIAEELTDLGYDHAGSLYHKIMPKAKDKGAFYTNNISALLLAKLTIKQDFVDWHNQEAVTKLKIMDPTCGTGTLLMAVLKVIKEQYAKAHDLNLDNLEDQVALEDLHKQLVENVIYGLDINQCGIQLAASNLTLGSPSVDYQRMNLYTLKHGIQPDGTVKAASLEILNNNNQIELIQSSRIQSTQVDNASGSSFPTANIDLVIMNPPFTSNTNRSAQYSPEDRKRMQQHELGIKNKVLNHNFEEGNTIDANAIGTFFTPIMNRLSDKLKGLISKVMPTTACTNSSGLGERKFIASRFHIERIITSHDPKRPNLSGNTGIHESLLVGRRYNNSNKDKPTEFISLKRMPRNNEEVEELMLAIDENVNQDAWLTRIEWSNNLMRDGDWIPVQWLDGKLASIATKIKENPNMTLLQNNYKIAPVGRSVRGVFEECLAEDKNAKPLVWSISSKKHTKLLSQPDSWYKAKANKSNQADALWQQRNHVFVAQKYNTIINSLTAIYSETATIGSLFMPIHLPTKIQKGFVAYWNSTPCLLMLLNLRSKMLTYPSWSQQQLYSLVIPKLNNPAWQDLTNAYEQTKNKTILTLKDGEKCEVRQIIDKASAKALGIDESEVAKWRSMLAKEPTISNQYASGVNKELAR